MEILCFFAGVAFVNIPSAYPLLLMAISLVFKPNWSKIAWFLGAILWSLIHIYGIKDKGMPDVLILNKVQLEGRIVSIPSHNFTKTQFQFHIQKLNGEPADAIILLACYQHCPIFKTGQQWHLEAKLKKPQNLANPGSYDFVSGLTARHIHWTGYIKRGAIQINESRGSRNVLLIREAMAKTMEDALPNSPTLGILQALTLNVTSHIDKEQWDLFRRTGTTHLMVISGSHIGLIAGFGFWLMRWLWSRSSRLCLYWPVTKMASLFGLFLALIYALLAGFEPPSQRSLLACFFMLLRNFLSQRFTVWQAWRYGLLLVLIYEPHVVLLPGFYLSFLAVAILILMNQRVAHNKIKKAICIQLGCIFGLMPLCLYWFSYGAVNGIAANILAIPLVGFVIVPLGLINLILMQCFEVHCLITPIEISIKALLYYLQWIDSFAMINLNFSFPDVLAPFALMLAMLIILFLPIKALIPAVCVLLISTLFPAYKQVTPGEVRVDVLDVGQGLAVVVQTAKHLLVYDTGMKFFQGSDMGKLALIPYLNTLGIRKIDKVVISHPDLDHRGGLLSLEEKFPISELLVDKVAFYHRGKACHKYPSWEWEGVMFRFFANNKTFGDKNNSSCVLSVDNGVGRVLFTGDIEKEAEDYLVHTYKTQLATDVLIVPHHGSKTSSSLNFIKETAPKYAIISAGFDNRYHFPHLKTMETFKRQKIAIYNTMNCGMVSVELTKKSTRIITSRPCQ